MFLSFLLFFLFLLLFDDHSAYKTIHLVKDRITREKQMAQKEEIKEWWLVGKLKKKNHDNWQAERKRSTHLEVRRQVILGGKNSRSMQQGRRPRMQSTKSKMYY